jgi:drug/metabolite transporter (DMT)-like permease
LIIICDSSAHSDDPACAVRLAFLTTIALLSFTGNSVLSRLALTRTAIDAASFTSIRLVSGALLLALLIRVRAAQTQKPAGSWLSAGALFAYAAGFSLAYVHLSTGTGALLLFGAVQATMITVGLLRGERLTIVQTVGLLLACAGLIGLVLPGLSAPPLTSAMLMLGAGAAWGMYSLRGRGVADPTTETAGNFLRAIPMAAGLSVAMSATRSIDTTGVIFAIVSGAITSGLGYVVWYAALRELRATTAATVQLSVPLLAAIVGATLLSERISARLLYAAIAILGGIALVLLRRQTPAPVSAR